MSYGLLSGLLWGLDTVLLGIVLGMSHFVQSEWIIFLAPFISTFFHDIFSSFCTLSVKYFILMFIILSLACVFLYHTVSGRIELNYVLCSV